MYLLSVHLAGEMVTTASVVEPGGLGSHDGRVWVLIGTAECHNTALSSQPSHSGPWPTPSAAPGPPPPPPPPSPPGGTRSPARRRRRRPHRRGRCCSSKRVWCTKFLPRYLPNIYSASLFAIKYTSSWFLS